MSRLTSRPTPKLGLGSAGLLMTTEEFDSVSDYDERYSYELIDGVLVVAPIPSEAESDPNEELGVMLRTDLLPDFELDLGHLLSIADKWR